MINVYTIHETLEGELAQARLRIHSDPQDAIERARSIADKAQAFSLTTIKGHALHIMTQACRTLGNQTEALEYVMESIEIFEQFQDFNMLSELHRWYGVLHFYSGAYPTALGQFIIGRNYALRTDHYEEVVRAQNCIGEVYRKAGDYPLALEAYESGIQTALDNNIYKGVGHLYSNMGEVHTILGDYNAAFKAYDAAKEHMEISDDVLLKFEWLYRMGKLHMQLGDYPKALENIDHSIDLLESLSNAYYILDALLLKHDLLLLMQDEPGALEMIYKAEKISEAGGSDHQLSLIYERLYQFFEKNEHYKKALEYHKRFQYTLQKIEATNLVFKLKMLEKEQNTSDEKARSRSIHQFINTAIEEKTSHLEMLSENIKPKASGVSGVNS